MSESKFLEWGNSLLSRKSKSVRVSKMNSRKIHELVSRMFAAIDKVGVGLASIQLGEPLRVIVINIEPNKRSGLKESFKLAAINPKILWNSREYEDGWEGNLCFPGVMGVVRRAKKIKVSYYNPQSEKIVEFLEGFPARVFQHEYEQLDGKNFISSMPDPTKLVTRSEYIKLYSKP